MANGVYPVIVPGVRRQSFEVKKVFRESGFTQLEIQRTTQGISISILNVTGSSSIILDRPINASILRDKLTGLRTNRVITNNQIKEAVNSSIINTLVEPLSQIEVDIFARGVLHGINVDHLLLTRRNPQFIYSQDLSSNLALVKNAASLLEKELQGIVDKEVVLFLGPTRSGKTTTMFYLDGTPMKMVDPHEELGLEVDTDDIIIPENGDNYMISHDTSQSYTFFPYLHNRPMVGTNLQLVDFPGFFDSTGWQVELACDLVLKKLFKLARSVRVVLILDYNSFLTTAANKPTEAISKLTNFVRHIETHCLVGITKKNKEFSTNQRRVIQGVIGNNLEFLMINQADLTSRDRLVERITGINPILYQTDVFKTPTLGGVGHFSVILEQDSTKLYIYTKILSKINPLNMTLQCTSVIENLTLLDSFLRLSDWLSDNSIVSILSDVDESIKNLLDINEPSLNSLIFRTEYEISQDLFNFSINCFYILWGNVEAATNGEEGFSKQEKDKLKKLLEKVKAKRDELSNLKNHVHQVNETNQFFSLDMFARVFGYLSSFFNGHNFRFDDPFIDLKTKTQNLHPRIRDIFEELYQNHRYIPITIVRQKQLVNYHFARLTLETILHFVSSSYKRNHLIAGAKERHQEIIDLESSEREIYERLKYTERIELNNEQHRRNFSDFLLSDKVCRYMVKSILLKNNSIKTGFDNKSKAILAISMLQKTIVLIKNNKLLNVNNDFQGLKNLKIKEANARTEERIGGYFWANLIKRFRIKILKTIMVESYLSLKNLMKSVPTRCHLPMTQEDIDSRNFKPILKEMKTLLEKKVGLQIQEQKENIFLSNIDLPSLTFVLEEDISLTSEKILRELCEELDTIFDINKNWFFETIFDTKGLKKAQMNQKILEAIIKVHNMLFIVALNKYSSLNSQPGDV